MRRGVASCLLLLVAACAGAGGPEEFAAAKDRAQELAFLILEAVAVPGYDVEIQSGETSCDPQPLRNFSVDGGVRTENLVPSPLRAAIDVLQTEGLEAITTTQFSTTGTQVTAREGALTVQVGYYENEALNVLVFTGCYRDE